MASVRFICGAQTLHRELEQAIAKHLGKDDAILFAACFDANGGVFEPLLDEDDAIISDSLNHASIIDGVRLCKAKRYRFANSRHGRARGPPEGGRRAGARFKLIATDGVFSMDGYRRQAEGDLRARRPLRRAGAWSTTATRPGISGEKGKGTPALTGRATASTSSPAPSARRSAAAWAASSPPRSRSSICCASARGPISSPTRSRPRSSPARCKALEIADRRRRSARAC